MSLYLLTWCPEQALCNPCNKVCNWTGPHWDLAFGENRVTSTLSGSIVGPIPLQQCPSPCGWVPAQSIVFKFSRWWEFYASYNPITGEIGARKFYPSGAPITFALTAGDLQYSISAVFGSADQGYSAPFYGEIRVPETFFNVATGLDFPIPCSATISGVGAPAWSGTDANAFCQPRVNRNI
jgi:hypothetical protein